MKTVEIAPNVVWFPRIFVNAYAIESDEGPILVDAGTDLGGFLLGDAFEGQFGVGARAIILTHGHLDHVGGAQELAQRWQCQVYVHPLERPFLVGKSRYPDFDPTVGGPLGLVSRLVPNSMFNLTGTLMDLPADGTVPFAPGWRWIAAPGHTPGGIALWNGSQKILLAGDALSTMEVNSWLGAAHWKPKLGGPAAPFTTDWVAAGHTLRELAALEPEVIGAGHGKPMSGRQLPDQLKQLARDFIPPAHGRYVKAPAVSNQDGLVSLPLKPTDSFYKHLAAAGLACLALCAILLGLNRKSKNGGP